MTKPPIFARASKRLMLASLSAMLLAACGGGSTSADPPTPPTPVPPVTPPTPTPPVIGATLTTLQVQDQAAAAQASLPVTFGQVFVKGEFPAGTGLAGVYGGVALPLQVNIKAAHADGSVRHAIISAVLPQLAAGQNTALALAKTATPPVTTGVTPASLLAGGFNATVKLNIGGQMYSVAAHELLESGYTTWLSGPVVNEWHVNAPLKTAANVVHPHLAARFAIRAYNGTSKVRVDVTIENNWAYEPDPKNVLYDAEVTLNGQSVYSKAALNHFQHARWRKVFWIGAEPKLHIKHNTAYLIKSQAVPNYDQALSISPTALTTLKTTWDAANAGPMDVALLNKYMPSTGGRPDIGLHHAWAAMYVLSMDARAKEATLGISDQGGSWPIHYRNKVSGQPVTIAEFPYVRTIRISSDSYNPVTKKYEDLPVCTATGLCATPFTPDTAHQASIAFLPYLVTGDAYHLEELHFWANWNLITMNPGYRLHAKGLVKGDQVRGQAWSLRSLAHAAYITPDGHPMKAYFSDVLGFNLDFYNATFAVAMPNQLGFIDNSAANAVVYPGPGGPSTGTAPWMDDFFTSSVGHLHELGFDKAKAILDWKAKYPVGRMTSPGYCWIDGAVYAMSVRASASSPYFTTFAEAWQATMRKADGSVLTNSTGAKYMDQPCGSKAQADWRTQQDKDLGANRNPWVAGEMTGYATSSEGYPSNMQPALAMAATTGIPNAQAAWTVFINRTPRPDYSSRPQFAIVPRN
jgi:hypothetical protein